MGAYLLFDRVVVWCVAPDLIGAAAWGSLLPEGVDRAVEVWEQALPQLTPPCDLLVDLRRIDTLPTATFSRLQNVVGARADSPRIIRRWLILSGPSPAGAAIAGLFVVMDIFHDGRCTSDVAAGQAWLGRDIAVVANLVETVTAVQGPDIVLRLRELLTQDLRSHTVPKAAGAFRMSPRALQRHLSAAGTSFREELRRVRIDAACELLATTTHTIGAIVRNVGLASQSSFTRVFRSAVGVNPQEYRDRTSAAQRPPGREDDAP